MVHIYYMRFNTSISDHEKDLYIQLLSEKRKKRVLRIKSSKAALECMETGLFLRYGLEQLEEKNLYQNVARRENGKPYIINSNIHFNLSHSGEYVILIIADRECGVDIQKQVKNQERLAKRIMHEQEYVCYAGEQEEMIKNEWLSWCWCAKEAYLKWTGAGIQYAMSTLNMSAFLSDSRVYHIEDMGKTKGGGYDMIIDDLPCTMLRFKLEQEYYGTICMERPFCLNSVKAIKIEQVFSHFNLK